MWIAVEKNLLQDPECRIYNISKLSIPHRIQRPFHVHIQLGKHKDLRKEAILAAGMEVGLMMTNALVMEHSLINSPGRQ